MQIIPAILSTSEKDFSRDVDRFNKSNSFKEGWVHIDFMDNKFVPNLSIDPEITGKYPLHLEKEAHAMVARPLEWIGKLADTGYKRVIFHIEAEDDTLETINSIRDKGLEVGLAINIDTPVNRIEPFADKIDVVLLMSIVPGFQGNPFKEEVFDKIREVKSKGWNIKVGVDGSVKDTNIKDIMDAGADFVIVGSFLLKGDIDENFQKLKEALL